MVPTETKVWKRKMNLQKKRKQFFCIFKLFFCKTAGANEVQIVLQNKKYCFDVFLIDCILLNLIITNGHNKKAFIFN
jgi:hypothetical protein